MKVKEEVRNASVLIDEEPQVKISKGKAYYYLSILWLLFFFDIAVRFGINPLFPLIQKDLGLTDGQLGLAGSAVLLGVTVFVLPISYLSDRWSKAKTISIMAVVWSAFTALTGFAANLPVMLASRLGVGVGEASYSSSAVSLITSWFKKSRWGAIIGIFNTAQPVAGCVGVILAGVLAVKYGWRAALIIFAVPSLILGLLALGIPETKLKKSKDEANKSGTNLFYSVKLLFKNKTLVISCVSFGLFGIANTANVTWAPSYMVRYLNFSVSKAALWSGLIALAGIPAYMLGGFILDRWYKKDLRSRMWFASIFSAIASVGFFTAIQLRSIPLIILSFFLTNTAFPTTIAVASQEIVPFRNKTISYGFMVFVGNLFAMLGPTLLGNFSQKYNLITAMSGFQAIFLLATVGFMISSIFYRQDYKRAREEEVQV